MMVVLAWLKKDELKLDEAELERLQEDVEDGFYELVRKSIKSGANYTTDQIKYKVLAFRNANNDTKMFFTDFTMKDEQVMK